MLRKSNENYINKLMITEYYSQDTIEYLARINKYDDIDIPKFCSNYLKNRDANITMVRCELVQYVADNSLQDSSEAMYACEDLLNSMEAVDDMLAIIAEGVNLRDIVNYTYTSFNNCDITGHDVMVSFGDKLQSTGEEILGLRVEKLGYGMYQLYYKGEQVHGKFSRLFSVDIVSGEVTATMTTDEHRVYTYKLGDPNGFTDS